MAHVGQELALGFGGGLGGPHGVEHRLLVSSEVGDVAENGDVPAQLVIGAAALRGQGDLGDEPGAVAARQDEVAVAMAGLWVSGCTSSVNWTRVGGPV